MARAPKKEATPLNAYLQGAARIWNDLYYASLKPFAGLTTPQTGSLLSDEISAVSESLGKPRVYYSHVRTATQVQAFLERHVGNGRTAFVQSLRLRRQKEAYTFNVTLNQGHALSFYSSVGDLPGSEEIPDSASRLQKLLPLQKALANLGLDFDPSKEGEQIVVFNSDKFAFSKEDLEKVQLSSIAGVVANSEPEGPLNSAVFSTKSGVVMRIDGDELDVEFSMVPFLEVTVGKEVLEKLVETSDKNSVPFLAFSWMQDALNTGLMNRKQWKSTRLLPTTDMRIMGERLDTLKRNRKAKARVNRNGFCIARDGFPMYVPDVDLTSDFMKSYSQVREGDDGYYSFSEEGVRWANHLLLTDWFNDVVLYVNSSGNISTHRMLGYSALDENSEYIILNTEAHDVRIMESLKVIEQVAGRVVPEEEATQFLPVEARGEDKLDGGKVRQSMGSLRYRLSVPFGRAINHSDPGFKHASDTSILFKHLLGFDLHELPSDEYAQMCMHYSAYLKALASKRKELQMPVMDRLRRVEYSLVMSTKAQKDFDSIREASKIYRDSLLSAPRRLDVIDLPNVDAGGNLKGFMPHQVRIISDMASSAAVVEGASKPANVNVPVAADVLEVGAGGGKTVLILADILLKKMKNPKWLPLIITKPGLVKNFVSEINFFTKGKVNVVVLRSRLLKNMRRNLKMDTSEKFFKWIESFPPNTIFITGYTDLVSRTLPYKDLVVPGRVFREDVGLTQFLHLIRLVGFEMVRCDESHLIKNMSSLRSQYTYAALAQATSKLEASGTVIANTAIDLVGQAYGISPAIYGGDVELFKSKYELSGGIIYDDDVATNLKSRMKRFMRISEASKEDWAFVLPDLMDHLAYTELTPLQNEFYEKLLQEAFLELKSKLEKKKASASSDDSDDDSDEDDDSDDEDDDDARIVAAAETSLARVEQFVVAPDSNEQYLQWEKQPRGDDLVSPMVRWIDNKLDVFFAQNQGDYTNRKVAVFGIHKVGSRHVMRHSRHVNKMIHYTAGQEDVIRQFKANPKIGVLVADSTSIREGENLQMLSMIIDMQPPWSPGDFEQLVSRMYRPDPKGIFNKDEVEHYWVLVDRPQGLPGIGSVKLARMISKTISSARMKYEGDIRWKHVSREFEDLGLLKMSLDFIFGSKKEDLAPYLNSWVRFVKWETGLNQSMRKKIAQDLEQENPGLSLVDHTSGRVKDRALFTKMVMREARSTKDIPGSKKAYAPWIYGATPPDPHNMGLEVVGSDEVNVGDYVVSEYGPSIVLGLSKNIVQLEVYGFRKVSLSRSRIAKPTSKEGEAKLKSIIESPTAWKSESMGGEFLLALDPLSAEASLAPEKAKKKLFANDPAPQGKPSKTPVPKDEINDDDKPIIEEIYVYLLNGMPGIVVYDAPDSVYDLGWYRVEDFVSVGFRSWNTAGKFLDLLAKKFAIPAKRMDILLDEMEELRDGTSMKLNKPIPKGVIRNFFLTDHRLLGKSKDGRQLINPYWVSIGNDIRLCFSTKAHPNSVVSSLRRIAAKNSGSVKYKVSDGYAVNLFNTIKEAAEDIMRLGKHFDIPQSVLRQELRELRDEIRALKGPRATPRRGK